MEQMQALQRAQEVEDRTRELYAAIERGDSSFPADFIAHGDESLVIDTDPGEWWSGYEKIVGTWSQQIKETAGVTFEDSDLRATRAATSPGSPTSRRSSCPTATVSPCA
jgi:SnoaL-like protein